MKTNTFADYWHLIGSLGMLLFATRNAVQWWHLEKNKQAKEFTKGFWLISIVGALISLIYFLKIGDPVNIVGPVFGLIAYSRNILFIVKIKK